MIDHWKCPHCGVSNEKTPRQGNVVQHLGGNQVLYQASHPGSCPGCGGRVNGAAILSGQYDDNWADLKDGLKQGFLGLVCLAWFIAAFWIFPSTFDQGWTVGIGSVLVWLSPAVWALRPR